MKDIEGKVAVITGGASGIGKAIAKRFITHGMKIVIADIEEKTLKNTYNELKKDGDLLPLFIDVSKYDQIEILLRRTLETYGKVHVLCNNAGVSADKLVWECTVKDWEWVIGVNLWGTINALRLFVPQMLKQKTECHIVNTASIHGFCSVPYHAPYNVTKHALVNLSEILHRELMIKESLIKVSVLCPGNVDTAFDKSERNRPVSYRNGNWITDTITKVKKPIHFNFSSSIVSHRTYLKEFSKTLDPEKREKLSPIHPDVVAEKVHEAIMNDIFYIFVPEGLDFLINKRYQEIVTRKNPSLFP